MKTTSQYLISWRDCWGRWHETRWPAPTAMSRDDVLLSFREGYEHRGAIMDASIVATEEIATIIHQEAT